MYLKDHQNFLELMAIIAWATSVTANKRSRTVCFFSW